MSVKEIEAKIKEYGDKLAVEVSARVKKRIFQKIGKLKKQLADSTATKSNPNSEVTSEANNKRPLEEVIDENDSDAEDASAKKPKSEEVEVIQKKLNRKEVKAKLHLLHQELSQMAVKKQLKFAKKVVRKHISKGFPMDVLAYTNLINVFVRCVDMEGALNVLEEMKAANLTPNKITFTTLLKGYCELGHMDSAGRLLFEHMIPTQQWNIRSLSTFLRGCQHTGYIDTAFYAFQTYFEEKATGNMIKDEEDVKDLQESSCFESMIHMLSQGGRVQSVVQTMSTYLQSIQTQSALLENIGLYVTLAKLMTIGGNFQEAKKYFDVAETLISTSDQSHLKDALKRRFDDIDEQGYTEEPTTKMSKSTELFQTYKRKELKHDLEILEDYITTIKALEIPVNGCIGTIKGLSVEEQVIIQSFQMYLENILNVFIFGYDGKGDVDRVSVHQSNVTISDRVLSIGDSLLLGIQRKFAMHSQQPLELLSMITTSATTTTKTTMLSTYLDKVLAQAANIYKQSIEESTGYLKLSHLLSQTNILSAEEINHVVSTNLKDNKDEERPEGKEDDDDDNDEKKVAKKEKTIPIKLEIGSGNGDWVVAQAEEERKFLDPHNPGKGYKCLAHWMAIELRTERVGSIFMKNMLTRTDLKRKLLPSTSSSSSGAHAGNEATIPSGVSSPSPTTYAYATPLPHNLTIIGGDAMKIVEQRIPRDSISAIFFNYPQPPERVTGGLKENQGAHLLTYEFFLELLQILKVNGTITILTDNLLYAQSLSQTILQLNNAPKSIVDHKLLSVKLDESDALNRHLQECVVDSKKEGTNSTGGTGGKVFIWRGEPGVEAGHVASTSSYFDRMWAFGQKKRRWFLFLKKRAKVDATLPTTKAGAEVTSTTANRTLSTTKSITKAESNKIAQK